MSDNESNNWFSKAGDLDDSSKSHYDSSESNQIESTVTDNARTEYHSGGSEHSTFIKPVKGLSDNKTNISRRETESVGDKYYGVHNNPHKTVKPMSGMDNDRSVTGGIAVNNEAIGKVKRWIPNSIKIICLLLVILCFVPAFTVSCQNQSVDVTAMHSVIGYDSEGSDFDMSWSGTATGSTYLADPAPSLLVLIVIPIGILLLWQIFDKTIKKNLWVHFVSVTGIAIDWYFWNQFRSLVFAYAHYYSADVKEKLGYFGSLGLLVLLAIAVIVNLLIISFASNDKTDFGTAK